MPTLRTCAPVLSRSLIASLVTVSMLLVFPPPAGANVLPDAVIYFNVKAPDSPDYYCQTTITDCGYMNPSTTLQGPVEFQMFIETYYHPSDPVTEWSVDLTWPDAWTLIGGAFCRDGEGSLDYWGGNPHHLDVSWPCVQRPNPFLALTLVFDVEGYGQLSFAQSPNMTLGCPPNNYTVRPVGGFGEAGAGCNYTNQRCVKFWYECLPGFSQTQIQLTAPEGETAHGQLQFEAWRYFDQECYGFVVHSSEPWATGYLVHADTQFMWNLEMDANATGLSPGDYQCDMQVELPGTDARCVDLMFHVSGPAGVGPPFSNMAAKPYELRLVGSNPSSGPFVFTYEDPASAPVRCGIFAASGRKVAALTEAAARGGLHTLVWNATDASGRHVAPGLYIIRLSHNGRVRSSRVVVVR